MPIADARPQHLAALDQANEVRFARSALKARLRDAESRKVALREAAALLTEPLPECARSMTVFSLLDACHGVGAFRTRRMLNKMRPAVYERCLLGHLTKRRLDELAAILRREAAQC